MTIERDVVFGTAGSGGRELRCDIYTKPGTPAGFPSTAGEGDRVGVLLIFGGGWYMGSKDVPYMYGVSLARAGYVAVVPECTNTPIIRRLIDPF